MTAATYLFPKLHKKRLELFTQSSSFAHISSDQATSSSLSLQPVSTTTDGISNSRNRTCACFYVSLLSLSFNGAIVLEMADNDGTNQLASITLTNGIDLALMCRGKPLPGFCLLTHTQLLPFRSETGPLDLPNENPAEWDYQSIDKLLQTPSLFRNSTDQFQPSSISIISLLWSIIWSSKMLESSAR